MDKKILKKVFDLLDKERKLTVSKIDISENEWRPFIPLLTFKMQFSVKDINPDLLAKILEVTENG